MRELTGRVGVITGAASGIGRALAVRLAREGMKLLLLDWKEEGLSETKALCTASPSVLLRKVDVSSKEEMEGAAKAALDAFDHVDLLVNNAGVASCGSFQAMSEETFRWTINVNFWGVVHGCRVFLPELVKRPEANLVNVSSIYGLLGVPGQSAYCASKFAVRGLTESLRIELRNTSVAVTLVHPGGVATSIDRTARVEGEREQAMARKIREKRSKRDRRSSPELAAEGILKGIRRNSPRVLVGRGSSLFDWAARCFPSIAGRFIGRYVDRNFSD